MSTYSKNIESFNLTNTTLFNTCAEISLSDPKFWFTFSENMLSCMNQHNGIGLAANQLGFNDRIFVMKIGNEIFRCVNPQITGHSDKTVSDYEGCLSFTGLSCHIERYENIKVEYYEPSKSKFKLIKKQLSGIHARCFQHELDHLNGITIIAKGIMHGNTKV